MRRWLQENDFAFLIKLGINEITSYKHCSYESIADTLEDRNIKNKGRAKLSAIILIKLSCHLVLFVVNFLALSAKSRAGAQRSQLPIPNNYIIFIASMSI